MNSIIQRPRPEVEVMVPISEREQRLEQLLRKQQAYLDQEIVTPERTFTRLNGGHIVCMFVAGMLGVFSLFAHVMNLMVASAEKSADRAHDLAAVAVEAASSNAGVMGGEASPIVYVAALFFGTSIIIFVLRHTGFK